jgi:very-short-patch-repair endonuclease
MDRTAYARRLRQDQTSAEKVLWKLVRNRRLGGFKFMRQITIDRYFADFVCETGKLTVELDGATHEGREDYDDLRTETLERFGYVVLRFRNERILTDPGGTADDILAALRLARPKPLTLPRLRRGPLPCIWIAGPLHDGLVL